MEMNEATIAMYPTNSTKQCVILSFCTLLFGLTNKLEKGRTFTAHVLYLVEWIVALRSSIGTFELVARYISHVADVCCRCRLSLGKEIDCGTYI